jgi:predicted ATPase/DNA-binding CsgD family transcriptional regulator
MPPRTGTLTKNSLAIQAQGSQPVTSFVGRDREVAALSALLHLPATRFVTITGAGGIGKTRLALAVATGAASAFADGVRFVSLAAVRDPNAVAAEIAQALGAQAVPRTAAHAHLAALLRDRSLLLVLDNFEHVTSAAPLLADLLATCPDVTLLVTSRAPLRVSGEQRFPILGLDLPNPANPDLAAIAQAGAVQLFLARARMIEPEFALTPRNAPSLVTLCRRLDGIPLALELAAARLSLLPVSELAERLSPALPLLTDGPQDHPPRLRTMADAIAWSYDLLTADEAALFRRLSVCQGGFSLDAAADIWSAWGPRASADPLAPGGDLLSPLAALVNHALVHRDNSSSGEPRYTLLEVVREYGIAKLAEYRELDAAHQAHAMWCVQAAEEAMPHLHGPEGSAWLRRLDLEQDNLRAALTWACASPRPDLGVRLAGALWWYWFHRGAWNEGRRWLELTLAATAGSNAPGPAARAHLGAGMLAWAQGSYDTAKEHLTASLDCWRRCPADAEVGYTLGFLGETLLAMGEPDAALPFATESLAVLDASPDRWGQGFARINLGNLARAQGDQQQAIAYYESAITMLRDVGDPWLLALPLRNLARFALQAGHLDRAEHLQREALALLQEPEERWYISRSFEELAAIAAARRNARRAARLLGAAQSLRDAIGAPLLPHYRDEHARVVAEVEAHLVPAFPAAFAAGSHLPLSEAIIEALAEPKRDAAHSVATPSLTPREREVLRLLANGHTDRESAAMLCISPRTVEQHITNIVNKLGATSRLNAVLRAAHQGLV